MRNQILIRGDSNRESVSLIKRFTMTKAVKMPPHVSEFRACSTVDPLKGIMYHQFKR